VLHAVSHRVWNRYVREVGGYNDRSTTAADNDASAILQRAIVVQMYALQRNGTNVLNCDRASVESFVHTTHDRPVSFEEASSKVARPHTEWWSH